MASHTRRRASWQIGTARRVAAFAVVCLGVAMLQPAQALRPEHQLANALTKASIEQMIRDASSGPRAPTITASSVGVDASSGAIRQSVPSVPQQDQVDEAQIALLAPMSVAKESTNQMITRQQMSPRERLASVSKHLSQHLPSVGVAGNQTAISQDVPWHLAESNRSVDERGVLVLITMLQVLGEQLKAGLGVPSSPLCEEEDPQGQHVGCRGGCSCRWYKQCYPKRSSEAPFEDSGVCEMSMTMMAAITVTTAGCILLLTVSMRLILQHHEFLCEHSQRAAARSALPLPGRKSFVDQMAERRALVHEKGLVRETLRNLPADLLSTSKAGEVLSRCQEKLRQSETFPRSPYGCSTPEASPEAAAFAGT